MIFIKELVQNEIILCFSKLLEEEGRFSFLKLYCVQFNKKPSIEENEKKSLEYKIQLAVLCFNKNIKNIRDKYVAHNDITNEVIRLPYKKIHLLFEKSKEIHKMFCEEIDYDLTNKNFNEKELNEVIDNQIHINKKIKDIVRYGKETVKIHRK